MRVYGLLRCETGVRLFAVSCEKFIPRKQPPEIDRGCCGSARVCLFFRRADLRLGGAANFGSCFGYCVGDPESRTAGTRCTFSEYPLLHTRTCNLRKLVKNLIIITASLAHFERRTCSSPPNSPRPFKRVPLGNQYLWTSVTRSSRKNLLLCL